MTHLIPKDLIVTPSGIRGKVGGTLDPAFVLHVGQAFGQYLGKGPVIVGGDTRTSFSLYKNCVIAGLVSVGIPVIDIGPCPTPTCQQMILHHQAQGAIVITASHNPIEWNGLKLMSRSGSFLNPEEYASFEKHLKAPVTHLVGPLDVPEITQDTRAIQRHVDKICTLIDISAIKKSGLKVLVDANHGAGACANPTLLDALGIEYDILHAEPNGRFVHDPEPLQKNLSALKEAMAKGNYDIGFAQDADADRLVILDETGHFIGEDYSLAFGIDYILSYLSEPQADIVVNLSTSLVLSDIAKKHNATLHITKIGEMHVTETLKSTKGIAGGEGNGGIIFPKVGWGRDSLVGITLALAYLAQTKKKVSEIVSAYPKYTMVRDKLKLSNPQEVAQLLEKAKTVFSDAQQDYADGVKCLFESSWIHIRPSNTEPIVRIFAEAPTADEANALVTRFKEYANIAP